MSSQLHAPAALPTRKDSPVPIGEEVGWTGRDDMEKLKFLPYRYSNCDPSVVQLVASRYTDYVTAALTLKICIILIEIIPVLQFWMDVFLFLKLWIDRNIICVSRHDKFHHKIILWCSHPFPFYWLIKFVTHFKALISACERNVFSIISGKLWSQNFFKSLLAIRITLDSIS
jgi:hypothetical protein